MSTASRQARTARGPLARMARQQRLCLCQKPVRGHDPVDQSDSPRLFGIDHVTREQELERPRFADEAGQSDRASVSRG